VEKKALEGRIEKPPREKQSRGNKGKKNHYIIVFHIERTSLVRGGPGRAG